MDKPLCLNKNVIYRESNRMKTTELGRNNYSIRNSLPFKIGTFVIYKLVLHNDLFAELVHEIVLLTICSRDKFLCLFP